MKAIALLPLIAAFLFLSGCGKDKAKDPKPPKTDQNDITAIDNAVKSFMATYKIPGVSIAIAKNDNLVYVKSYGQMSATDNTVIKNNSLFRIASVSKPITSVGIMKLLEAGKISMDQKVFGSSGILKEFTSTQMDKIEDITVKQLLTHTTGLWPNDGNDPMFKNSTMNHHDLIQWTLNNAPASKSVRGQYKYSNFGYCLLGRIIEKLSGKSYEQYIKDEVLKPSGINDMSICGNTLAERKPNEVLYDGQGYNPFSFNASRMDSHGGWIASATDLARFMVKVNGLSGKSDILKPATITTMTTQGAPGSNYASGWAVNSGGNWWHTGALPGTASEIIRSSSGFCWVVLCNSRSYDGQFDSAFDNLIWPFIQNSSTPWQDIDQF